MSSYLRVEKELLLRYNEFLSHSKERIVAPIDDLLSYYSNTMSEYSGELLLQ